MRESSSVSTLDWTCSPLDVMAAWPGDRPLMMLHSGRSHAQWARWSILARPRVRFQFDGRSRLIGDAPQELRHINFTHDPLTDLDAILSATRFEHCDRLSGSFQGGWIGYLSYDLGRWIEPRAQSPGGAADDRQWPLIDLAWCPAALLFDQGRNAWHQVDCMNDIGPAHWIVNSEMQNLKSRISHLRVESLRPDLSREAYVQMVRRVMQYIAAGDIFQTNLAQRMTARFEGSMRALGAAAFRTGRPWYGAHLEFPAEAPATDRRALISLSPELFLHVDPRTRQVTTRPIKGTRPGATRTAELRDSVKDAAELHMIIDLMRNDLGRVCDFATVQVAKARSIERHPTVQHGVGEVIGTLRRDVSVGDLLRATFPGGSVTGAPKIRAMQIIDELEPVRRGPYCGAIGYIGDDGAINLNIAIRTMLLQGRADVNEHDFLDGSLDYSTGAGIVADSEPAKEYEESLDKAAVVDLIFNEICRRQSQPRCIPAGR